MQGFTGGALVKNLPASAGDTRDVGLIPGWEDSLEKNRATRSSILTWRIPWAEEPCRLQSCKSDMTDPLNRQYNANNTYIKLTMYARNSSKILILY